MKNDSGRYTHFGEAMSDQCPWHFVLHIEDEESIRYQGPLLCQAMSALEEILAHNELVELYRRAGLFRRYPSVAVKEGVINALIHFDMSRYEDITIDMRFDGLTIWSPGGMCKTHSWKDVSLTNPRNWKMAMFLREHGLVTLKGSGMSVIKGGYKRSGIVPCISYDDNTFTMHMPPLDNEAKDAKNIKENAKKILRRKPGSSIQDLAGAMMLSEYSVKRVLMKMEAEDEIACFGLGSR